MSKEDLEMIEEFLDVQVANANGRESILQGRCGGTFSLRALRNRVRQELANLSLIRKPVSA